MLIEEIRKLLCGDCQEKIEKLLCEYPLHEKINKIIIHKKTKRPAKIRIAGLTWLDTNQTCLDWDYIEGITSIPKINYANFKIATKVEVKKIKEKL